MKVLKLQDVLDLTGLSRSAVYEMCAKGEFPTKVHLTARSVGWLWKGKSTGGFNNKLPSVKRSKEAI